MHVSARPVGKAAERAFMHLARCPLRVPPGLYASQRGIESCRELVVQKAIILGNNK